MINVKNYGAIGNGIADDTSAIQSALNLGENVFFPQGNYKITQKLILPSSTSLSGRKSFIKIFGEHYSRSVIVNASNDYTIDQSGADALFIEDLGIYTETGGGIKITSDCGGLHVNRFFMNGCADGFWGIYSNTGYTLSIRDSRFWHNFGYIGGAIYLNNCLGGEIQDCFISQQRKNGACIELDSCKAVSIHNCQLEGANQNSTVQTLVKLSNYNQNISLRDLYLEGNWDVGFEINGSCKMCNIDNIRAWNYENCENSQIVKVLGASHFGISANRIQYINNSTGISSSYIFDDINNILDLNNSKLLIDQSSGANQLTRQWRSQISTSSNQFITSKYCSGASFCDTQLSQSGVYLISTNIVTQDGNHKGFICDLVTYDDTGAYKLNTVKNINVANIGTVSPSNIIGNIDSFGKYKISFNANQAGTYKVVQSILKLN